QGLGSGPIALAGAAGLKEKYLAPAASGDAIAAFALSEPDAGSDVQAMSTTARRAGGGWTLNGTKTWISNGGIAPFYVVFAQALVDFQMTQAKLADMATRIEAGALLAYRAGWKKDVKGERVTREAAMAKMFATEAAQQVVDDAVQICGGLGVMRGHPVERLYREVRALRIYEGATEVQKVIIARELLKP